MLLFSGGKDSIVMLHLAIKAFAPARVPFPVARRHRPQLRRGHRHRDELCSATGCASVVASVEDDIDAGRSSTTACPAIRCRP